MPLPSTDGKKSGGRPAGYALSRHGGGERAARGKAERVGGPVITLSRQDLMPESRRLPGLFREWRLRRGLSLHEVARRAKLARNTVLHAEQEGAVITFEVAVRLAIVLEIPWPLVLLPQENSVPADWSI